MGLWSNWYEKNAGKETNLVNAEWVLKKIDEGSSENAPKNATLNDAAESSVLPATASAPIVTLLQTIRNNLKYLFNNKAPINTTLTDATASDTLPAITNTATAILLQTIRNNLKHLFANKADKSNTYTKTEIINKIYPVGSIYMSVNSINPGTYLTGTTWAIWGKGRVPVGVQESDSLFDTVEKTGGEKTHTLTYSEIPDHNHIVVSHKGSVDSGSKDDVCDNEGSNVLRYGPSGDYPSVVTLKQVRENYDSNYTISSGFPYPGDGPHNNLQPYITCYMWKRTG